MESIVATSVQKQGEQRYLPDRGRYNKYGKARPNGPEKDQESSASDASVTKYVQIPRKDYYQYEQKGSISKPRAHLVAYREQGLKAVPRNLNELPARENRSGSESHSDSEFPILEKHQFYYVSSNHDSKEEDSDGEIETRGKTKPRVILKPRPEVVLIPRENAPATRHSNPSFCDTDSGMSDGDERQDAKRKKEPPKKRKLPSKSAASAAASR
jgi:hypothetical protein